MRFLFHTKQPKLFKKQKQFKRTRSYNYIRTVELKRKLRTLCVLIHQVLPYGLRSSIRNMAVWRNFGQLKYILVFLCCCFLINRISSTEINLGGPWMVQNANKSLSVYGEVPGNVHTALFRNGTISNPYFRFNDVTYRWIAYDNWTYSRTLEG